jgi:hypothetical protein
LEWPRATGNWSANGKIAFDNGSPSSGDILVISADGGGLEQLTRPGYAQHPPRLIAQRPEDRVHEHADGNDEIYFMNADGTDPTRLTFNPATDNAAAWSPDGQKILFQSARDGNVEIRSRIRCR